MNEVRRGAVQRYDLNRAAQDGFQVPLERELRRIERRSWLAGEEDANVDITGRTRLAPSHAAEEVDGHGSPWIVFEEGPEAGLGGVRVHSPMIPPQPPDPSRAQRAESSEWPQSRRAKCA